MSQFEFVFSLYGLLLGLGIADLEIQRVVIAALAAICGAMSLALSDVRIRNLRQRACVRSPKMEPKMTREQEQPKDAKGAKSGLAPGDGAHPAKESQGPKRPIEEEDVFGGAERTHNEDVNSPRAKP